MYSALLPTGRLSPVRVDSSVSNPEHVISLPSATILSPVSRSTTSPTTNSSLGRTCVSPPRTTFTLSLSYSLPSNSKALSDLPSIIMVSPTERAIATNMPTHSYTSPSPVRKNLPIFTPTVITHANSRIIRVGSERHENSLPKKLFFRFFGRRFAPNFVLFVLTTSAASPFFTELPTARSTSLNLAV